MLFIAKVYYIIFGLLTIAGGVIGYVRAHSIPSLVSGGLSGLILLVAGYLLPERVQPGLVIGLVVSVLLAGRFLPAFIEKKALFPAGIMAVLSLAGLVITLLAWYKR
jgi:uncharacterized membrane protein (UPF0136 family)